MDEAAREAALEARRRMLGDEYVSRAMADQSPAAVEFQRYVTEVAWSRWTREETLSWRDRSLVTIAITAAMGRLAELELHLGSYRKAGVTDEEIDELIMHLIAYAGAPAGVSARRIVTRLRAEAAAGGQDGQE